MLSVLVVAVIALVLAPLIGHVVHWMLHQRWAGPFYKGHMEHHLDHYPPESLTSPAYKMPKWYHSGPVLFTPAFLIIVAVMGGLTYLLSLPIIPMVTFCVTVLTFGMANDTIHDAFHVEKSLIHHIPGFAKMRDLHFYHHCNMRKNYGIIVYTWDKLFGTLRDE